MLYAERLWCQDFRKVVQDLLDGKDLPAATKRGIREHREACPVCCEFHDQMVQLTALSVEIMPPSEYEAVDSVELWKKIIRDVNERH